MLSKLYELKLMEYRLTGKKEIPSHLLAMLLLPHMSEFTEFKMSIGDFYQKYKDKIDEMIAKVIFDFNFTDEEMEKVISNKRISNQNYEYEKIWVIFYEGLRALYWGVNQQDSVSPEAVYSYSFNQGSNWASLENQHIEIKKKYEQETYTLRQLYELKFMEYQLTGKKEAPDQLLAMLLLAEKNNFGPLKDSTGEFYKKYKKEIDKQITRVENDFDFTPLEIGKMIEDKGIYSEDYAYDKLWFVFSEGFGAVQWGQLYHASATPEEIYSHYFQQSLIYPSFKEKYEKIRQLFNQTKTSKDDKSVILNKQ